MAPADVRARPPATGWPSFFLAGTWSDWRDFEPLLPAEGIPAGVCRASVLVRRAPGVEEFQVVEDCDWARRHHPSSAGRNIEGPDGRHGVNWRAEVPAGCERLEVTWDPRGKRSLRWRFVASSGEAWSEKIVDSRTARTLPYFLVGSWDGWADFTELRPRDARDLAYRARVRPRRRVEELQVVQGRDWDRRFYPAGPGTDAEVLGPGRPPHGMNWRVEIPDLHACRWIAVSWDPRGARSLRWSLLAEDGSELNPPSSLDARAAIPEVATEQLQGGEGQIWEVVGGEDTGGVLVREGPLLSSPKATERLATGALLRELALERSDAASERLRFQRLTGSGPEEGWISVALNHKVLAQRLEVPLGATPEEAQLEVLKQQVHRNTRHVRGALCAEDDTGLFEALWAELDTSGRWRPPGSMAFVDSRYRHAVDPDLAASAFVLRTLLATLNAELVMWWANLYEDGSTGCDWHRDAHSSHKVNVTVSASFGGERDLTMLHTPTRSEFNFPQQNGDIIAFSDWIDDHFLHRVCPTDEEVGPRISVILMGRTRVWAEEVDGGCIKQRCELLHKSSHDVVNLATEEIERQDGGIQKQQDQLQKLCDGYEATMLQCRDPEGISNLYIKLQTTRNQLELLQRRREAIERVRREAAERTTTVERAPGG